MHIHEYQAKEIFSQYNIQIPQSILINDVSEAISACKSIGGNIWVVKAQVHAGGRGKGGGVILSRSISEVEEACNKLFGTKLVTPQTDSKGLPVNKLLIEGGQNIENELYLGLLVDRQTQELLYLLLLKVAWI